MVWLSALCGCEGITFRGLKNNDKYNDYYTFSFNGPLHSAISSNNLSIERDMNRLAILFKAGVLH